MTNNRGVRHEFEITDVDARSVFDLACPQCGNPDVRLGAVHIENPADMDRASVVLFTKNNLDDDWETLCRGPLLSICGVRPIEDLSYEVGAHQSVFFALEYNNEEGCAECGAAGIFFEIRFAPEGTRFFWSWLT